MFYGTQNLLEKSASAFAPLLLAIVLLAGDNASDPLGVRLVGPVAGVLVFIGYLSFRGLHARRTDDRGVSGGAVSPVRPGAASAGAT